VDGFTAFKYYTALKLHFTSEKFDVFVNRGRVKGSYATFASRNDRLLFEKIARMFPTDKQCIQFIAANFMYGNANVVYNIEQSLENFRTFERRKQAITRVFTDDIDTIINSGAQYDFSGHKIPDIIQLYIANRITLETVVILNDLDSIVDNAKQSSHMSLLLGDELLRIEKSKRFVKYDRSKIIGQYQRFIEEVKGTENGQDLSPR
jgi:hypothetical protein